MSPPPRSTQIALITVLENIRLPYVIEGNTLTVHAEFFFDDNGEIDKMYEYRPGSEIHIETPEDSNA
jgi:hypothetical protein